MTCKTVLTSMIAAAALSAPALAAGDKSGRIEIGYLECNLLSDDGNILVSEQRFSCNFDPAESGMPDEAYVAEIDKFGVDLSRTDEERIAWAVFAPAEKWKNGVLAGDYFGIAADAAVGVGIGAKAMVGGFEDSIALQPLSATSQKGVGVSLAVENMKLIFRGDKS